MAYPCLNCNNEVTNRQEAIPCDSCNRWCHTKCGTGITRQEYRAAVRDNKDLEWSCEECNLMPGQPLLQSTPIYGE